MIMKKKIKIPGEPVYFFAILLISFSVAMITATDFGVSMIVAPAYILSLKLDFLTFGQCEYIVQGILFVIFCISVKKVKAVYFTSFLTGVIYGAVLDLWRLVIPAFNPEITPPGSLPFGIRIVFFIFGMFLTSFSVALFFKTYLYPQVYDFFVKGISSKFGLNRTKFKICFDVSCLAAAVIMTLVFFRGFRGIGIGTLIMTALNGMIIGMFGRLLDRFFEFRPIFGKFSEKFDLH